MGDDLEENTKNYYPLPNTWITCVKEPLLDNRVIRGHKYLFLGIITNPEPLEEVLLLDDRGIFTTFFDPSFFEIVK